VTATLEETRQLLTVGDWAELVTTTENLSTISVPLDGTGGLTVFSLPSGWNLGLKDMADTDLTEAKMRVGQDEYGLTKAAIMAVANRIGLPNAYVFKTPGPMIQSHLNYWATHSPDTMLKFLARPTTDGPEILAVTKENIVPFSNLDLLARTLKQVRDRHSLSPEDLKVDFKSHHDLAVTSLRLVLPDVSVDVRGDKWSAGLQVRNSLTGKTPLSVQGYLFRWAQSNAMVTLHSAGKYNRKIQGQNLIEVLDWVSEAVDVVMDSETHEFEALESVADEPLEAPSRVLADIFKTYKVPLRVRNVILDSLQDSGNYTYYGLINAITEAANEEGVPEHFVTAILEIAGDVMHSASTRCMNCKRVLP
jgi:hypothetical protein